MVHTCKSLGFKLGLLFIAQPIYKTLYTITNYIDWVETYSQITLIVLEFGLN